jgi:hypothetical protein
MIQMYLRTTCTNTIQLTHARDYTKNLKKCTNQNIGEILNTPKWSTELKELKFLNIQIAATEVADEYITASCCFDSYIQEYTNCCNQSC